MLSRLWNAAANDTVGGRGGHATTVLRGYGGAQAYGGAFSGSVADRSLKPGSGGRELVCRSEW
jgi:hypothetical protein